jgi:hypothetical protein
VPATLWVRPGCAWTVQSSAPWLSVGSGSGTGRSTLTVTVQVNTTGQPRTGTLSVGLASVFVVQAGAAATGDPAACSNLRLQREGDQTPAQGLSGATSVGVFADGQWLGGAERRHLDQPDCRRRRQRNAPSATSRNRTSTPRSVRRRSPSARRSSSSINSARKWGPAELQLGWRRRFRRQFGRGLGGSLAAIRADRKFRSTLHPDGPNGPPAAGGAPNLLHWERGGLSYCAHSGHRRTSCAG